MTDDPTEAIETPTEQPIPAPSEAPGLVDAAAAAPPPAPPLAPVAAASGGGRTRWVVALGVAGLAVAATVGAVVLFGQQAAPSALQYIPADAAVVAELRLDLPGDQMQHLGNLLAHFPGFADQSTLTAKLDQALEKLIQSGGKSDVNYQADVKPWLSGPAFLGVLNLTNSTTGASPADVVVSLTTSGTAACANLFKGETPAHETYKGFDLVTSASGSMTCVLDGRQALLGTSANVKKALDAKAAGTGMDKSANYKAARTALGGDRLATAYIDGSAMKKLIPEATLATPGMAGLLGEIPPWFMAGVRAEDDAFVLDYVAAPAPAATGGPSFVAIPPAHASAIAPMVPGDTLVFVEAQGAGASLQNLLIQLHQIPELGASLRALDGLGGGGDLVGWIDDVGVAVSLHGTTPDVAAIIVAKDEAAVTSRVASLKTLLTLAGSGNGIDVKSSTIAGVDVTTVTITNLGALIPPGSIPGLGDITPTGPISFSIAARGKTLLVTTGEGAMAALLNRAAGSSLADNAAFKHAAARGIGTAQATVYVGVGATVDLVKGFLNADQLATFQKDAAPYVEPFEGFLVQAVSDATGNRSRMVITVTTQP